jgi:dTDP-4-amino-4,6-dideoxygalactose transaminase
VSEKSRVDELAALGGAPAFASELHVGRPSIRGREALLCRLNDVFESQWLTNHGPCEVELERRLGDVFGVEHCVATCNGTLALQLLLRALGLRGTVLVPSFTFIATAHAVSWEGLTPVFCDVLTADHTLSPEAVEAAMTADVSAILGVHLWGNPCAVDALRVIAERHGVPLIFDAAHAFACARRGKPVGSLGDAEVFSFHATKVFQTLEGGAIATADDALARELRLLRDFGIAGPDRSIRVGTNAKMNEVSAAMGLAALEHLPEVIDDNRKRHELYVALLSGIPGVKVLCPSDENTSNYQYVVVDVDERRAELDRDSLGKILHAEGVLARRYFSPGCHRAEPYAERPGAGERSLPVTDALSARVLVLPTGPALSLNDVRGVASIVRLAVEHAPRVREAAQCLAPGPFWYAAEPM